MTGRNRPSFGIKTTPEQVSYDQIVRVWREADTIPEIEHAWLWDHLLPVSGDLAGPIHDAWTLLAALAAQTRRIRLGTMVTSNRMRPPAMPAKIAATVDVISNGRLDLGIGVGAAPGHPLARREYDAYGLPFVSARDAVASLAEACVIIRRLWTEEEFDFAGQHYHLIGAQCNPKPVQRPHPPMLVGAWANRTLRVVAEHADIWNIPGPPNHGVEELVERSHVLDEHCAALGRDPAEIIRSVQIPVSYDDPARTRETLHRLIAAGFSHVVLNLAAPYPNHVARWVTDELIEPVLDH